jgi:peptidoglycan-N-acetylmuramic acid deacetylase
MFKFLSVWGAVAAISALSVFGGGNAKPISWGLGGFGGERVPTAPPNANELLQKYDGLYYFETDKKEVLLTFDLGYEAGHTGAVLDILKANKIKAIFFLCGGYMGQTELIERIITDGHMVGNHTDKHKDLPTLSTEAIEKDIMTLQNEFTDKFPHSPAPKFFRPPQGRVDEKVLQIAKDNGLRTTMWSIAIKDWGKTPYDADAGAKKIASRVHAGAIILSHITNSATPDMIEKLIPLLETAGYSFADPANI